MAQLKPRIVGACRRLPGTAALPLMPHPPLSLRARSFATPKEPHHHSNIHPIHGNDGPPSLRTRIAIVAASTAVAAISLIVAARIVHSEPSVAAAAATAVDATKNKDSDPLREQIEVAQKHPGVALWGSNRSGTIRPGFPDHNVVEPVQLTAFAGHALRDLVFSDTYASAINERGDLVQWGIIPNTASKTSSESTSGPVPPQTTVSGRDLVKVASTKSTVFTLTRTGSLLRIQNAPGGSSANVVHIPLPPDAKPGEKIVSIACGSGHLAAVTDQGSVYTLQAEIPPSGTPLSHLGIGGKEKLTNLQPDVLHKLSMLSHVKCDKVAAGSSHTLIGSADGRVFAFGSNQFGQLGTGATGDFKENEPVEVTAIWSEDAQVPLATATPPPGTICTQIAAGGDTSFFVVDTPKSTRVFSCGNGQQGQLGNANFLQVQHVPTKIGALSDLTEYDEKTRSLTPIRVSKIVASDTHCAAVLESSEAAAGSASKTISSMLGLGWMFGSGRNSVPIYGRDVLFWGKNSSGQLLRADGKRGNTALPGFARTLIPPSTGAPVGQDDQRGGDHTNVRLQIVPPLPTNFVDGVRTAKQDIALGRDVTAVFTKTA